MFIINNKIKWFKSTDAEEGTDMRTVLDNYIPVGKVSSSILRS